jgi:hypothetical protein
MGTECELNGLTIRSTVATGRIGRGLHTHRITLREAVAVADRAAAIKAGYAKVVRRLEHPVASERGPVFLYCTPACNGNNASHRTQPLETGTPVTCRRCGGGEGA